MEWFQWLGRFLGWLLLCLPILLIGGSIASAIYEWGFRAGVARAIELGEQEPPKDTDYLDVIAERLPRELKAARENAERIKAAREKREKAEQRRRSR
jgi:hypothetical protein